MNAELFYRLFDLLKNYITTVSALRRVIEQIIEIIESEKAVAVSEYRAGIFDQAEKERNRLYEVLVHLAVNDSEIHKALLLGHKVAAVKILRTQTGLSSGSLALLKRAVEDDRVTAKVKERGALNALRNKLTDSNLPECPEW